MRLSTRTINIILLVCVAAMVAVCAMSICAPVNFDRHRAQREAVVKERLVRIRAAQERYRKATGTYDLITANIVAAAIISLAPHVPALLAPGAVFIASGIIDTRKDEVIAGVTAAGLDVVEIHEKNGWVALVCRRKGE